MLLAPHPVAAATGVSLVRSIDATVARVDGRWMFTFVVDGTGDLVLPVAVEPGRADGLWRTTCFEAFVALGGTAYIELNFSPSRAWAAYRFDGPRAGMCAEKADIVIRFEAGEGWLAIEAAVELPALASGAALNLTAVIEEQNGKSYWALAHPAGPPDFHDSSCFIARLPE